MPSSSKKQKISKDGKTSGTKPKDVSSRPNEIKNETSTSKTQKNVLKNFTKQKDGKPVKKNKPKTFGSVKTKITNTKDCEIKTNSSNDVKSLNISNDNPNDALMALATLASQQKDSMEQRRVKVEDQGDFQFDENVGSNQFHNSGVQGQIQNGQVQNCQIQNDQLQNGQIQSIQVQSNQIRNGQFQNQIQVQNNQILPNGTVLQNGSIIQNGQIFQNGLIQNSPLAIQAQQSNQIVQNQLNTPVQHLIQPSLIPQAQVLQSPQIPQMIQTSQPQLIQNPQYLQSQIKPTNQMISQYIQPQIGNSGSHLQVPQIQQNSQVPQIQAPQIQPSQFKQNQNQPIMIQQPVFQPQIGQSPRIGVTLAQSSPAQFQPQTIEVQQQFQPQIQLQHQSMPTQTNFQQNQPLQQSLIQQPLIQQPLIQQPLIQQTLIQQPLVHQPLIKQSLNPQTVIQSLPQPLPQQPIFQPQLLQTLIEQPTELPNTNQLTISASTIGPTQPPHGRIFCIKGYEIAGFTKVYNKQNVESGGEPFLCLPHLMDTALKKIPNQDIEQALNTLNIQRYDCSAQQLQLLKDSNIPLIVENDEEKMKDIDGAENGVNVGINMAVNGGGVNSQSSKTLNSGGMNANVGSNVVFNGTGSRVPTPSLASIGKKMSKTLKSDSKPAKSIKKAASTNSPKKKKEKQDQTEKNVVVKHENKKATSTPSLIKESKSKDKKVKKEAKKTAGANVMLPPSLPYQKKRASSASSRVSSPSNKNKKERTKTQSTSSNTTTISSTTAATGTTSYLTASASPPSTLPSSSLPASSSLSNPQHQQQSSSSLVALPSSPLPETNASTSASTTMAPTAAADAVPRLPYSVTSTHSTNALPIVNSCTSSPSPVPTGTRNETSNKHTKSNKRAPSTPSVYKNTNSLASENCSILAPAPKTICNTTQISPYFQSFQNPDSNGLLVTNTDAERLIAYLCDLTGRCSIKPEEEDSCLPIEHSCFGGCEGRLYPNHLLDAFSVCVQCNKCLAWFSPANFVSHSHELEAKVFHMGFQESNWKYYVHISESNFEYPEELESYKVSCQELQNIKDRFPAQKWLVGDDVPLIREVPPSLPSDQLAVIHSHYENQQFIQNQLQNQLQSQLQNQINLQNQLNINQLQNQVQNQIQNPVHNQVQNQIQNQVQKIQISENLEPLSLPSHTNHNQQANFPQESVCDSQAEQQENQQYENTENALLNQQFEDNRTNNDFEPQSTENSTLLLQAPGDQLMENQQQELLEVNDADPGQVHATLNMLRQQNQLVGQDNNNALRHLARVASQQIGQNTGHNLSQNQHLQNQQIQQIQNQHNVQNTQTSLNQQHLNQQIINQQNQHNATHQLLQNRTQLRTSTPLELQQKNLIGSKRPVSMHRFIANPSAVSSFGPTDSKQLKLENPKQEICDNNEIDSQLLRNQVQSQNALIQQFLQHRQDSDARFSALTSRLQETESRMEELKNNHDQLVCYIQNLGQSVRQNSCSTPNTQVSGNQNGNLQNGQGQNGQVQNSLVRNDQVQTGQNVQINVENGLNQLQNVQIQNIQVQNAQIQNGHIQNRHLQAQIQNIQQNAHHNVINAQLQNNQLQASQNSLIQVPSQLQNQTPQHIQLHQLVNQNIANQNLANQHLANQNMTNQNVTNQNISNQNLIQQNIAAQQQMVVSHNGTIMPSSQHILPTANSSGNSISQQPLQQNAMIDAATFIQLKAQQDAVAVTLHQNVQSVAVQQNLGITGSSIQQPVNSQIVHQNMFQAPVPQMSQPSPNQQ